MTVRSEFRKIEQLAAERACLRAIRDSIFSFPRSAWERVFHRSAVKALATVSDAN